MAVSFGAQCISTLLTSYVLHTMMLFDNSMFQEPRWCSASSLSAFNDVSSLSVIMRKFVFISSFHWNELMQSRGVRRPSVCLSVRLSVCKLCANRFFYHRSGWIGTKLAHDGPHMGPHPGCAQGQGQRSRDTGTFLPALKSLLLPQT